MTKHIVLIKNIISTLRKSLDMSPKHDPPLPEWYPVFLGLLWEPLVPLLIQTPHLAAFLHVSFCLFGHRERRSLQIEIGTVFTEESTGESDFWP